MTMHQYNQDGKLIDANDIVTALRPELTADSGAREVLVASLAKMPISILKDLAMGANLIIRERQPKEIIISDQSLPNLGR